MAELCEQRCHGVCVFLDQEAVSAVRDILCGTAAAHTLASSQAAASRTTRPFVSNVDGNRNRSPLQYHARMTLRSHWGEVKEHAVRKPKLVCVGDDLVLIPAAADEDHAERVPPRPELFERVQRDAQARTVPHHAAHEQEKPARPPADQSPGRPRARPPPVRGRVRSRRRSASRASRPDSRASAGSPLPHG